MTRVFYYHFVQLLLQQSQDLCLAVSDKETRVEKYFIATGLHRLRDKCIKLAQLTYHRFTGYCYKTHEEPRNSNMVQNFQVEPGLVSWTCQAGVESRRELFQDIFLFLVRPEVLQEQLFFDILANFFLVLPEV